MDRCTKCGSAIGDPEQPCPGCLLRLALREPNEHASDGARRLLLGGAGSLLLAIGLGVGSLMGAGALALASPAPSRNAETTPQAADQFESRTKTHRLDTEQSRLATDEARVRAEHAAGRARADAERAAADAERAAADAERAATDAARQSATARAAALEAASAMAEATVRAKNAAMEPVRPGCGDAFELETNAALGRLTAPQQECLDAASDGTSLRLLTLNAYSRGDAAAWERWAIQVWEVEPDADIAYKLALHHERPGAWADARTWAGRAMELRGTWTGETYTARVDRLLQITHRADLETLGPDHAATRLSEAALAEFRRASGRRR
jgi:hypothetical protein